MFSVVCLFFVRDAAVTGPVLIFVIYVLHKLYKCGLKLSYSSFT